MLLKMQWLPLKKQQLLPKLQLKKRPMLLPMLLPMRLLHPLKKLPSKLSLFRIEKCTGKAV